MLRTLLPKILGVVFLVALRCHAVEVINVRLNHPASRILLAEDNSYLAVAHYEGNVVSIIHTGTFTVEKTLKVPSPGPMLSRGTTLYVADCAKGVIKVFSTKDWSLVDEVDAGGDEALYLSAPQRRAFQDKMLVTSQRKSDRKRIVRLVDLANNTIKMVDDAEFACYSYAGRQVLEHKGTTGQSYRVMYDAATYAPGTSTPIAKSPGHTEWDLFQNADDGLWFSPRSIWTGVPPESRQTKDAPGVIVPDNTEDSAYCYVLGFNSRVFVHALDDDLTKLGEVDLSREPGLRSTPRQPGALAADRGGRHYAFAAGGSTTLFFIDESDRLKVVRFATYPAAAAPYVKQLEKADRYVIVKAPEGTTISDTGLLKWTPDSKTPSGDYVFKVRLERADGPAFFHDQITIKQRDDTAAPASLFHSAEPITIESDPAGGTVLVLSGDQLLQYDASGMRVVSSGRLGRGYEKVVAGKGYLAALAKNAVDILDPVRYQLLRRVDFGAFEARGLVVDRARNQLFIGGFDPGEKSGPAMFPIYRVDPAKGTKQAVKRALGETLFMDERHGLLASVISESRTHIVGMGYLTARLDFLGLYRVEGDSLALDGSVVDLVTGIHSVQFSHDGARIAVHAGGTNYGGEQRFNTSPVFATNDLKKPLDFIGPNEAHKFGQTLAIATHPHLDLVAILTAGDPQRPEAETLLLLRDFAGKDLTLKYGLAPVLKGRATGLAFTPDGSALLLVAQDFYGRPLLKRLPLTLSKSEAAAAARPVVPPAATAKTEAAPAARPRGKGLPLWQAAQLMTARTAVLEPEWISSINMPAVVVVKNNDGSSGAGFFVSQSGYLITAAHVISTLEKPRVLGYIDFFFNYRSTFEVDAELIALDEARDLALLKVSPGFGVKSVRLNKATPRQGERAYAIGHPADGKGLLNYTITSGLVSNASRVVEGDVYLQVSAPINPGNSGGPILDAAGNVIGMVSKKSNFDGAAFAVPAADIAAFLSATVDRTETHDKSGPAVNAAIKQLRAKGITPISDISLTNGLALRQGTDAPFTGKLGVLDASQKLWITADFNRGRTHGLICEYYPDQKLRFQGEARAGERAGPQTGWYPSGNLEYELTLRDGAPDGVERTYYDRPDRVRTMRTYLAGKFQGPAYDMNEAGRLTKRYVLQNGNIVSVTTLGHSGRAESDPYVESIKAGDVEMVRRLAGKRKAASAEQTGPSPLQLAIDTDQPEMVEEVLRNGADPKQPDGAGQTPLERAKARTPVNEKIVQILSAKMSAARP